MRRALALPVVPGRVLIRGLTGASASQNLGKQDTDASTGPARANGIADWTMEFADEHLMKLGFADAHTPYASGSQSARVWTERWVRDSFFCPNCGHASILQFPV